MVVSPYDVVSPRDRWRMKDVLRTGGAWSLAMGCWDGKRALVMRWNGSEAGGLGNPVSHGQPTWFVLPEDCWWPLLALVPPEKRAEAVGWLWASDDQISN